eukprot:s6067_g1.t1
MDFGLLRMKKVLLPGTATYFPKDVIVEDLANFIMPKARERAEKLAAELQELKRAPERAEKLAAELQELKRVFTDEGRDGLLRALQRMDRDVKECSPMRAPERGEKLAAELQELKRVFTDEGRDGLLRALQRMDRDVVRALGLKAGLKVLLLGTTTFFPKDVIVEDLANFVNPEAGCRCSCRFQNH